ncbi:unnamed protein product [Heligmosomoides polygyrus]|uniref:Fibrous sheath-interacting protein 1 n=1 Tax=Heligmosomoides polygyrus TaxID=6339 RepID=A0A3P7XJ54_HELPZ|nr:unnamed protein product [Heligmosomoides polygyrus]
MEYRVRCCGYPEDCEDWILDSKTDCPEAIKEYWESMKKEVPGPPKKRSHEETCEDEGFSKSIEADEEEDDLEREVIEANHEFLELIDEVGEKDGAPDERDAEAMLAEDVDGEQDAPQDAPQLVDEGQLPEIPENPDVAVEVEHAPEDAEAPIQRPMEGEDPAAERERRIQQLQEDLRTSAARAAVEAGRHYPQPVAETRGKDCRGLRQGAETDVLQDASVPARQGYKN